MGMKRTSAPAPKPSPTWGGFVEKQGDFKMKKWIILGTLSLFLTGTNTVQAAGPQINQSAPDFTLPSSDGKSVTLSSFQGKYVVLEWYNHGCPFVRKQYDSNTMQKLQADYTAKGAVWLSILSSAEGKEGYMTAAEAEANWATEKSSATAVLLDPDGKVGKLYQAKTTPNMFVINPVGNLIYSGAIDDRPTVDVADVPGAKNYVARALDQAMSGKTITDPVTKSVWLLRQIPLITAIRHHPHPGARQHNLKDINLEIPRDKLVVITGLSGSGKSSLAFDTIYAEGQRRYVESLSAYARQFLELMEKPDVDLIEGLSPSIAIEQRNPSHNPRSTVGTVTEVYDYLRLLFARVGKPHCPRCGKEIKPQSAQQIIDEILKRPNGAKLQILAPLIRGRIGTYEELFARLRQSGFVRVRVDGQILGLEEDIKLDRYKKHTIELVVDRIVLNADVRERLADSVETALRESRGSVLVVRSEELGDRKNIPNSLHLTPNAFEHLYSEHHACAECGISFPEIEPRMFSFNSPYGACSTCDGLGSKLDVNPELVIPDDTLSIADGAIQAWSDPVTTRMHRWKKSWASYYEEILEDVCRRNRIPVQKPWKDLSKEQQKLILYGGGQYKVHWGKNDQEFEGVVNQLERRYKESESEFVKEEVMNRFMQRRLCPDCKGARLKPESLAVTVGGQNIFQICSLSVSKAAEFFENWPPPHPACGRPSPSRERGTPAPSPAKERAGG